MTEQKDFFSTNHLRLLNIATWAKYLAWIALVVYAIAAVLQTFQYQVLLQNNLQIQMDFWRFLSHNPFEAFRFGINMARTLISGIVYYLVLKGISLGLNMIVETDINYREHRGVHNEQRTS